MQKDVPRLRGRAEMHQHLLAVSKDTLLETKLYPILLKSAGEQRVPRGVATTVALAIHVYGRKHPQNIPNIASRFAEKFIDAIMADPKVASEAKIHLKAIIAQPQKPHMVKMK